MTCLFCGSSSRTESCPRCRAELRRELIVAIVVGVAFGAVIAASFVAAWLP